MAKSKVPPSNIPITDRTYFYSDLAFMPEEIKESQLWMAQSLFFAKLNSVQFIPTKRIKEYRDLARLELNVAEYKQLIDPPTTMGGGGTAEYFAADWKAFPIAVHLNNIVRAKLDKIGVENKLQVNEIDKFAKTQRQRDKDKIIFQREFRKLINEVNEDIGLPPIKESESPYQYVQKLNKQEGEGSVVDDLSGLIDYIRSQIHDNQDLSLYERYIYKGDIERSFELGIQHYLINQNKWRIKSEYFIDDLKNFNKACGEWYIDETTGRGTVRYFEGDRLFTSPFKDRNGDDIMYWFYEEPIPFSDFARQFGTTLTDEQLKEVFELNKYSGAAGSAGHGIDWSNQATRSRNNAMIMVGKFAILTQEANRFSESYVNDKHPSWERKPLSWKPDTESAVQKQLIYDVWYSCYYIPPPGERLTKNSQASWDWQSKYIFNIKKDIEMYRYGVDMRYARSTLVVWKDDRPSFMDIQEAFMPKIHTTWHKFQNCLIQDTNADIIDWDFMMGILNATDEANKINPGDPDKPTGGNGTDAGIKMFKMIKQGGIGFMKFRDKNGNLIPGLDPSKFFVHFDTGHLDKAERLLTIILQQYQLMMVSLAQNDLTEGQDPKPRTPVAGVEASLAAAANGIWFLEKPVREFTICYGERAVQTIIYLIKERKREGNTRRWREFSDVIGLANALMLEGIEDMQPEEIGLTVSLEDTTANQQYVFELANKMAANKEIGYEGMLLVTETAKHSYKYAMALLMMEVKRRERENADKDELAHQRQMELSQEQLKIAMALQNAKSQGVNQNIQTQGQVDAQLDQQLTQLKTQSLMAQKNQMLQNKLIENEQKSGLKKEEKIAEQFTPITT